MKALAKIILILFILPAASFAGNGYWDSMIWDQDNWYEAVAGAGSISGHIESLVTGQISNILGATVTVLETGQSTTTDADGNYTLSDLQVGTYTLKIQKTGFETVVLNDIQVLENQNTSAPLTDMTFASCDCGLKGDINDDGKIGLEEAIWALQIVSGIESNDRSINCFRTGCSGTECASEVIFTTCEYQPYYECYNLSRCLTQNGECVWEQNQVFLDCLSQHGIAP